MMLPERRRFGSGKAWESMVPLLNYHVPLMLSCCGCWREESRPGISQDMLGRYMIDGVSRNAGAVVDSVKVTNDGVAATELSNWCFVVDRVMKRERLDDRLDGTFWDHRRFSWFTDIKNFTSYFHVNGYLT
jgi:hypothetical protein